MITEQLELHSILLPLSSGCLAPLASMVIPGSKYSTFTLNSFTVQCRNLKEQKKIVVVDFCCAMISNLVKTKQKFPSFHPGPRRPHDRARPRIVS